MKKEELISEERDQANDLNDASPKYKGNYIIKFLLTSFLGVVACFAAFFLVKDVLNVTPDSRMASFILISWAMVIIAFYLDVYMRKALYGKKNYPEFQSGDNFYAILSICLSGVLSILFWVSTMAIFGVIGARLLKLNPELILYGWGFIFGVPYFYVLPLFVAHRVVRFRSRKKK